MTEINQRVGGRPMQLVIKSSRFLKIRMMLAHGLIQLAYKVGGVQFKKPVVLETRAEKRRKKFRR